MRPSDKARAAAIEQQLVEFDSAIRKLPGISSAAARATLVEQIIESLRRIEYAHLVRDSQIDPLRADPSSELFDPLRAAVLNLRKGNGAEAFWLVFLATHFGKHAKDGWRFTRAIYGALGGKPWMWRDVSSDVDSFRSWLDEHKAELARYRFSNHRKYQSLGAFSKVGTGAVVASYVKWIGPPRSPQEMIRQVHTQVGQEPSAVFDRLYKSMKAVTGFGRLGRFDYLTMLGKLGAAPIEPGSAYLVGSTGPLSGARLLFGGNPNSKLTARELDMYLVELDERVAVGMQVLEDSICNWQKSPKKFVSFRG